MRARIFEIRWSWLEGLSWLLRREQYTQMHCDCVERHGPSEVLS